MKIFSVLFREPVQRKWTLQRTVVNFSVSCRVVVSLISAIPRIRSIARLLIITSPRRQPKIRKTQLFPRRSTREAALPPSHGVFLRSSCSFSEPSCPSGANASPIGPRKMANQRRLVYKYKNHTLGIILQALLQALSHDQLENLETVPLH